MAMDLYIATTNKHKVVEMNEMLQGVANIRSVAELGIIDIDEIYETFEENAMLKSTTYSAKYRDKYILSEDSGLCVDCLGGAPGVFSARYSGDGSNVSNVLLLMKNIEEALAINKNGDRGATFVSVISLSVNGVPLGSFRGEVSGVIDTSYTPDEGAFGYDPVFICQGVRFSDMTVTEKNRISHRYKAMEKLKLFLESYSC